jgi:hypothetical protein
MLRVFFFVIVANLAVWQVACAGEQALSRIDARAATVTTEMHSLDSRPRSERRLAASDVTTAATLGKPQCDNLEYAILGSAGVCAESAEFSRSEAAKRLPYS